ncbi:MAG: HlyC/CorC family transporter [Acidimicrobiales bacterium]|nr:HlyC/CorC family transporter [Acidimicrobiales bacterium]
MLVVAFLVIVVVNALFVAAEFGLVASDRTRVSKAADEGDRRAGTAVGLFRRTSFHLSSAQFGITVASLLLGFVSRPAVGGIVEPLLERFMSEDAAAGASLVLALLLATTFLMVVGEQVPKYVALAKPAGTLYALARPMSVWGLLVKPIVLLLNGAANWIVQRFGVEPKEELDVTHDLAELAIMIESSGTEGTLDPEEVDLLTRSIRFSEKDAAEALVPRVEIRALGTEATAAELVELSIQTGFSRFPVIGDDLDDVRGVVHVKSLYSLPVDQRGSAPVHQLMAPVLAVPEARELELLFADLRDNRDHLAIVVDEHGGTAGIITLEDLLEEIVGEIDDEYDGSAAAATTRVEQRGSYVISAGLHADEVRDATGFEMPEGDYETLAGFLLNELGHIPDPGEIVVHDDWRIEVVAMNRLRIVTARVVAPADRVGKIGGRP